MQQTFSQFSDEGGLLSGYNLGVCSDCGFCFADKIPEQASFDIYYRDLSKYEKTERAGQDSPYDLARFQILANIILRFLPDRQAKILEIGCANGQLLAILKNQGYPNVSGIDPSPVSAEIVRQRYNINVSANTLSDFSVETESVDYLILAGVLEHVRELHTSLQRLRETLSIGGRIFIVVPDASRYAEGEDAPFQELSIEHINYFGPQSLTNLMHTSGFELVATEQGSIESSYRTINPVIFGVFQKAGTSSTWTPDTQTEPGLIAYINQSRQADDLIDHTIQEVVSGGYPIVVWGTGSHTLRLLANSSLREANIRAYVDSNPRYQGKQLSGKPIISPQSLDKDSGTILISSRVYQKDIIEQIRNVLQLDNQIITIYPMD
jgi:2-polyprenyl-3-methyl-5-hydroxy-6-metoxy-1,4-benzoquinol methylase